MIKIIPCLEKEINISPAIIKKIIWEIEKTDSFFSFNLNDRFVNLFLFLLIALNYFKLGVVKPQPLQEEP